ncbi:hypothetical protein AQUCO_03700017v1 [Aquilegia coerulea]|uniref:GDT1 family protein n=1 Tax=Aquilegia coerulea TaxID=218851 RepID=A0A2G5CTC4_AQUCA|nr:hypothetical protein AQUCO_03700017v1 [Aquilegia coerulea]
MRTLTLPESVLSPKSQHFHEKDQNLFTPSSSLVCFKSHSLKQKQFYVNLTSNFAFSRKSKHWFKDANVNLKWNGFSPKTSTPKSDQFDGESYLTTHETMHIEQIRSTSQDCTYTSFMSSHSWLKFPMLVGLLTLLDSQQALAGSEFATGLQSITYLGDLGDISTGFASAFLLIFFSELGDKTFFIAALLAARNSGPVIFIGTFGALAAMTVISVVLGRTFHYVDDILPFRFGETDLPLDDIAAVCLLVYFGVSTLIEAASSDGLKTEEEQKEAELAVSDFTGNGAGLLAAASTVFSTFLVVFVAEWGDKSFFSTIALAAASSPLGVIGGALAGHAVATLLAVLGGSLLGTFLSEKTVAYVGGTLFLVFAAVTLIEIVT